MVWILGYLLGAWFVYQQSTIPSIVVSALWPVALVLWVVSFITGE